MATGVALDGAGFEVLVGGQRVGSRRVLEAADVAFLDDVAARYGRAVVSGAQDGVFLDLGRELYRWLDGDGGRLSGVRERAVAPVVFEVAGPARPGAAAWAVLRAPWEVLAAPGEEGFWAGDGLMRFSVVRRLGVRGEPAGPALDGFRLGLAFMASSPRGQAELDFEAEEAAVLAAVGQTRLDLLVEDTGDPEQLGSRLAEVGGMPVVHLSCHGTNAWRDPARPGTAAVPVLMMEDDEGAERATTAADLVQLLPGPPRLVFVSACLTATGAGPGSGGGGHLPPGAGRKQGSGGEGRDAGAGRDAGEGRDAGAGRDAGEGRDAGAGRDDGAAGGLVAHSLATALVAAGVPAVLGWDGSVDDVAATVFAGELYGRLAGRVDVAVAVGDARRAVLAAEESRVRADWHLARLWVGPGGGGPVVAGTRRRSMVSPTRGTKVFLAGKAQVPVAAPEMFVGRRPELQAALRALRSGDTAGVLLHGQGRLGKSSLAARIADRFPDRAVAVVFGDYSPLGVLDAVAAAVKDVPAARTLIEQRVPEVRQRPQALESVLVDLLAGPCAQVDGARRPLLLVIDDLERLLVGDASGAHRVRAEHAGTLAAVLRAFDPSMTDSRLVVTSRFTFTLDGLEECLEPVQLRALSRVAQRKLQRRQQAGVPAERVAERADLAARALAVSRGNPGLQDLIGLRLVYGVDVPAARAEAAVAGMEAYLDQGDLPSDAEVRAFLENLALDALLDEAGPADRDLLRATTVFTVPVPATVVEALAAAVGGSLARLRGLGLLDPHPDGYDPSRVAVSANPLTVGRVTPLTDPERAAAAQVCVGPLFAAWGGTSPGTRRPGELDLQLTRLALLAEDADVVAACAARAVGALAGAHAGQAAHLGQAAVTLLDRHGRTPRLGLLRATAKATFTAGDGATAHALSDRAVSQAEAATDQTGDGRTDGDPGVEDLERARVLAEHAQQLVARGRPDEAEPLLRQALGLFDAGGSFREAAITWGQVGDIVQARGDLEEALRIRREVELPVYERLGDVRSAAVTWGQIGDIVQARGDLEEALRIRREVELPVYERLGDVREAAVTWGKIGDIAEARGDLAEALRIRREVQLPVYERLGDVREAAVTWGRVGDIVQARGDLEEALRIRREVQLPVYERLGDVRSAAVTWGRIGDIAQARGDLAEALRIRREVELPVYDRLGDVREAAITWGKIGDIVQARGDLEEALRIRREVQLPVYERLGDVRSAAITWGQVGDIVQARGDLEEALRIRREVELPVYERLGDVRSAAVTWGQIGDIVQARGDLEEGLRIRREVELPVYERLGDVRSTAVTWGKIGDIAEARGDLEEGLRIRREVELPVYGRLGDVRATAVTWGKIGNIALQRGDLSEALELQTRRLEVNRRLGDLDGIAAANWDLARIDLAKQDHEAALPRLSEAFEDFGRLQRPDGIAVVGRTLGDLLLARGEAATASLVLHQSHAAALAIGATGLAEQIAGLLQRATKGADDQ